MIIQSQIPSLVLSQQSKTQTVYIYFINGKVYNLLTYYSCSSNYMWLSNNTNSKNSQPQRW